MLTTIAMTRGDFAFAADWSQTLDASGNVAYDTNPALLAGSSLVDRAAQLNVDGNTELATEVSQLTITPHFSITRYDQDKNLDVTTGSLALAFQDKGERDQWSFSGLAQNDSTLTSELGQTDIADVNFRHEAYNASLSYQYQWTERFAWLVTGTGQIARYSSAAESYGLSGYTYGGIQAAPTWNFSDRLQGSLSLESDHVSAQSGTSERDYSASLQLQRILSEKYSWHVSAGATRVDIAGSSATPSNGVFELGVTQQGERIQWDVSAKRAVLPIGLGFLARQDVATLSAIVSVSERSTLNLSCNVMRTDPVSLVLYLAPGFPFTYQLYGGAVFEQAVANWEYHISPQWALSAAYTRSRARNYALTEWANGEQARLGFVWQSNRL